MSTPKRKKVDDMYRDFVFYDFFQKAICKVTELFYPSKCVVCHNFIDNHTDGVCEKCKSEFNIFDMEICLKNFENNDGFSMLLYTDTIKDIIHNFKYNDCGFYARAMGKEMGKFFVESNILSADYIVPVPLHSKRKRERGYNQVEIMALEISKITKIPLVTNAFVRKKNTLPQYELDVEKRFKNVEDAFYPKNFECVKGKEVMLIDDIYTTGATINECRKVLYSMGANKVFYFTLASTKTITKF